MQAIIITGLSGAGKSQAMECLEDQEFYCIDNMPPALINNFVELTLDKRSGIEKVAFVVDVRGGEIFGDIKDAVDSLKERDVEVKVLFLEANDDELLRRFDATRRVHPLTKKPATVNEIKQEREALEGIRKKADFIIDTSNMKAAALKRQLLEVLDDNNKEETFVVNITSFGFKYGIPVTADVVFDMRFIPNPFYVPSLKRLTGNSRKVKNYVMKFQETKSFIKTFDKLVNNIIPSYMREGKWNLNIAFGCTGGQHRSVAMANEFYEKFKTQGKEVTLEHRDIKKK